MPEPRTTPLKSQLLASAGFSHGFFTRVGGVSEGPYQSLNVSLGVGDDASRVEHNRRRISRALGVQAERLLLARQVHGRDVVVVDSLASRQSTAALAADALVARDGAVACCVLTADCVPVLVADPVGGGVAAVHAGWRGTAQNIVSAVVSKLVELGSEARHLLAAIGPHISVNAFEVGEEVAEALSSPEGTGDAIRRSPGKRPHADLGLVLRVQLERSGLPPTQIETVGGCTVNEAHRFFSYRRDGKSSGRQLSGIVPRQLSARHY